MRLKFFLMGFIVIFLLSDCKKENVIKIGGIVPLSGDYYLDGIDKKNGIELGILKRKEILGKKIDFIFEDSKSEGLKAMEIYNKLAADKDICGIIDCGNSILSEDVASVSQKKILPLIISTASLDKITSYGKNIFRIGCLDKDQSECMARFALKNLKLKNKTAAVLFNKESSYSVNLAKEFINEFKNGGGEIITEQVYLNSDTDFSLQLNKIKILKPDLLFLPDSVYNVALILDQVKSKNLDLIILGADTYDNLIKQSLDQDFINEIYFCSNYFYGNPSKENKIFIREYEKKYKKKPSVFAALSYDAINIFLDAIEKAKSLEKDKIICELNKIKFKGVTGEIIFDKDGNPVKKLNIVKISEGRNKFVKMDDKN